MPELNIFPIQILCKNKANKIRLVKMRVKYFYYLHNFTRLKYLHFLNYLLATIIFSYSRNNLLALVLFIYLHGVFNSAEYFIAEKTFTRMESKNFKACKTRGYIYIH